ncbi:MAG: lipoyl(octanoyl) transferase LipB, partial [Bacteroidia bacterium]
LILVEHNPVYTFGNRANWHHLLISDERLKEIGAEAFEIERGGDITYHGPGQLVAYPIFDLEALGMGVKDYVWNVEEAIIRTLADFELTAARVTDRIGVWMDIGLPQERKIAAIGIKCSRYMTMHGLALNVNTDLRMFQHIVPCGIADKGVSSMQKELNRQIDMKAVKTALGTHFASLFSLNYLKNEQ